MFALKYHGGYSLYESYFLPVGIRKWTVNKLIDQLEKEKEALSKNK